MTRAALSIFSAVLFSEKAGPKESKGHGTSRPRAKKGRISSRGRNWYLDLTPGSANMQDIQTLMDRGVTVLYEPQYDPSRVYEITVRLVDREDRPIPNVEVLYSGGRH